MLRCYTSSWLGDTKHGMGRHESLLRGKVKVTRSFVSYAVHLTVKAIRSSAVNGYLIHTNMPNIKLFTNA